MKLVNRAHSLQMQYAETHDIMATPPLVLAVPDIEGHIA